MLINTFKSGKYISQGDYSTFLPALINHSWTWDDAELNTLLEQASSELGGLNSYSELIPNIEIYIKMHIRTEANKSNKIEGTKTSIEEDLLSIEDISPEKRDDYQEVHNYIDAMNHEITRIIQDDFPLSSRLIREIHAILLRGVRGENKTPGEFRKSQNWIGGSKPSDATYVPPSIVDLEELLSDLEKFIHNDKLNVPHLIKIALIHYQFETIHPFLDGNGRIGRLIVPLYLLNKELLYSPCFYISNYFEQHRRDYYDGLNDVRTHNDLLKWMKFFLKAVVYTAKDAKEKFKKVTEYTRRIEDLIIESSFKSQSSIEVLRAFYENPIMNRSQIVAATTVGKTTVDTVIKHLLDMNILVEITGYSRNRIFVLNDYIEFFF